jgi:cytochrome c
MPIRLRTPVEGRSSRAAVGIAAFVLLAATAGSAAAEEAYVKAGKVMFEHRCRICHADDLALKSYGPPLVGVVGRKAGSYPGFEYSEAMKKAGFVWTAGGLRSWMADNTHMLPGTKMRHVGVTDAGEQDLIAAYLASLSPKK